MVKVLLRLSLLAGLSAALLFGAYQTSQAGGVCKAQGSQCVNVSCLGDCQGPPCHCVR